MRAGDLVQVKDRYGCKFMCVALEVTKAYLRKGLNSRETGLHLFCGYWYGTKPMSIDSYGKIEGRRGRVVGRLRGHVQAKKMLG